MLIFFLLTVSLIPLIFLAFGLVCRFLPPRTINGWYGYRTPWSMKSQETWDYAHEQVGRIWVWVSLPMEILSLLVLWPFAWGTEDTLAMAGLGITLVQLLILVFTLFPIEAGLHRTFDEKGNRKKREASE